MKKQDADIRHFKLVSIGTGYTPTVVNFGELVKSGKLGWASPVIQMGMDGTSTASHLSMESIFGRRQDGKHYYRIQTVLPEKYSQMDDPEVVEYLCSVAGNKVDDAELRLLLQSLNQHRMLAAEDVAEFIPEDLDIAEQYARRMEGHGEADTQ